MRSAPTAGKIGLQLLFIGASVLTLLALAMCIAGLLDLFGLPNSGLIAVGDGKDLVYFAILIVVTVRFLFGWRALLKKVRAGRGDSPS